MSTLAAVVFCSPPSPMLCFQKILYICIGSIFSNAAKLAMTRACWMLASFFFISLFFFSGSLCCTFTLSNYCPQTIWPGTLSGSGTPQLGSTGFRLDPGRSVRFAGVPPGWSGRIWARTGCTFDATGVGWCQTGDCGGKLQCQGNGATPPASLFEITLGKGPGDKDFYDVSLVDGYNLPILALPRGGASSTFGGCNSTGCTSDLNMGCPKELQVVSVEKEGEGEVGPTGGIVACKSACEAFGLDQYCCSGEFANPTTCRPSFYSTIFKKACPSAYSYAFDDATSTFTCKALDYAIIFCPNSNGTRWPNGEFPQSMPQHGSGAAGKTLSSTNIYLPLPISILLLKLAYINL